MNINKITWSRKTRLIKRLADSSCTKRHELLEECLGYYGACGLQELSEEQVEDFCKLKGIAIQDMNFKA